MLFEKAGPLINEQEPPFAADFHFAIAADMAPTAHSPPLNDGTGRVPADR
ncbi:MAG: hypothetical protein Kow0040_10940 [Thermogutta sp.]